MECVVFCVEEAIVVMMGRGGWWSKFVVFCCVWVCAREVLYLIGQLVTVQARAARRVNLGIL